MQGRCPGTFADPFTSISSRTSQAIDDTVDDGSADVQEDDDFQGCCENTGQHGGDSLFIRPRVVSYDEVEAPSASLLPVDAAEDHSDAGGQDIQIDRFVQIVVCAVFDSANRVRCAG